MPVWEAIRRHGLRVTVGIVGLLGLGAEGVSHAEPVPSQPTAAPSQTETMTYPPSRRTDLVETLHGVDVPDPYRWLEDPDSDETRAWVEAQNKVTFGYLGSLPDRGAIRQRLQDLYDYERFGLPVQRGERMFYTRNDGLQNQSVLYVTDTPEGEPRVLLDPNTLSEDGTVSLAGWRPSYDGTMLAYALATAGSDWTEWKLIDVASGDDRPDHLKWVKFSGVSWKPDGSGFYYSRYDEPAPGTEMTGTNYYQKLYFHAIGQPQDQDTLVYHRPDEKEWGFSGGVTEDGRYLIISVSKGTLRKNQVFFRDLQADGDDVIELVSGFRAEYDFLGNIGSVFYFSTDEDAVNNRIVSVDVAKDRTAFTTVVPEAESKLESASMTGGRLFCDYLVDAASAVEVYRPDGTKERTIELPGLGSAGGFGGLADAKETYYVYSSFTVPARIYRYEIATGESTLYREPDVDFDPDAYVTKRLFATSPDGTKVPVFVTHKKDLAFDQPRPTILYAYGGFNISLTPGFSTTNVIWLESGGVYAQACLRGGGEYGRQWHEGGMLDKKQNVFNDFIACAEMLIAEGIASPKTLAIRGGSNGGLLVGAVMTQRPELFAAALPAVGVMDMLRFHKFTIGWAWVSEYGSADDPEQFPTLIQYSPLHNLKPGKTYPPTMVLTGDHDDRVVPAHSHKFAAQLQHVQPPEGPPVLIRIETSAGHGAGKPIAKILDEAADALAFIGAQTGWSMKPAR